MVGGDDKTVDVFLLVDNILDKRVNFAIGERIKFEDIRVGLVSKRGIVFSHNIPHRGNPAAAPHLANFPIAI